MRKPKGFMSNVAATGIGKRSPADVRFDRMRRQPREVFDELRRRAGHDNTLVRVPTVETGIARRCVSPSVPGAQLSQAAGFDFDEA
jgi:phage-related protein